MRDHEALGLELPERVPDRDAADAELLGQALLGEPRSGGEAPGQDVVPQVGRDLLRQRSSFQLALDGDSRTRYTVLAEFWQ
jgi:hypothetical protein